MKFQLLSISIIFCLLRCAADQAAFDISAAKLESLAYAPDGDDGKALDSAYNETRSNWLSLTESEKTSGRSESYSNLALKYAGVSIEHGNAGSAKAALEDALAVVASKSNVLGSSKGGTQVLEERAKLVADIWLGTGSNPIIGKEDLFSFEISKTSKGFIVLSEAAPDALTDEEGNSIIAPVPTIPDKEKIGYLLRLSSAGNNAHILERGLVSFFSPAEKTSLFKRVAAAYKYRPSGPKGPAAFERQPSEYILSNDNTANEKREGRLSHEEREATSTKNLTPKQSDSSHFQLNNPSVWVSVAVLALATGVYFLARKRNNSV